MDNISFWLSKVLWAVFSPAHFVVILFLLSFLTQSNIFKNILRGIVALFLIAALSLPVGDWALLPLEQCNADQGMPMHVDGVLVLGGAVNVNMSDARNSIAMNDASERLFALLKLIKQYPQAQFIYAGGSSSLKHVDKGEADYVKAFLDDLGMRPQTMIFEAKSRNTYEDAMYTKEFYGSTPKQNWLLVTSAFHMPRSYGLFQQMGEASETTFYPYTVDYNTSGQFKFELRFDLATTLFKLDEAAHEYVGLLFNKLMGRSNSYMPCGAKTQASL